MQNAPELPGSSPPSALADITAAPQLLRRLEESERRLRAIFDQTSVGIAETDSSHVWVSNSVSLIRGPGGEPHYVLAVTFDFRRASGGATPFTGPSRT